MEMEGSVECSSLAFSVWDFNMMLSNQHKSKEKAQSEMPLLSAALLNVF